MYRHGFTSFFPLPSPRLEFKPCSKDSFQIPGEPLELPPHTVPSGGGAAAAAADGDDDNNDVMMLCVRSWVFAGKVSPKFVQLAYKVPVSVSRDPHVIKKSALLLHINLIKERNREQMGRALVGCLCKIVMG